MVYEESTGLLYWKPKPVTNHFHRIWNTRFAGKIIGSLDSNGYLETSIDYEKFRVHRLIWFYHYQYWPDNVDHTDGDRLNNRIRNLRDVSHTENMRNIKKPCTNKSSVIGVHRHSQNDSWVVQIWENNKIKHVGSFRDFEMAVAARKQAEVEHGYHENHGKG